MMDDFLLRALLAGIGIAIAAGPLGCFVVWRRMAYFGATLSHSALLGVAIGFWLGVAPHVGIAAICIALALLLTVLERQHDLALDTLLGVLAHVSLAGGLVLIAFMETLRVDLMAYLFGDVLATSVTDLWIILGVAVMTLALLAWQWRALLGITISEDLAAVEGIDVARARLVLVLLLAIVVATAMKIVGMLLVVALLVIPPAVARGFARTPEGMAIGATAVGVASVLLGLWGSVSFDLPSGPAIVLVASLGFAVSRWRARATLAADG